MRALSLVLSGLLAMFAVEATAASRTVAVHPLQPLGTEQEIVDRLEELLRAEVGRLEGVKLQERAITVKAVPQSDEASAGCNTEICLAQIGRACQVDELIFGTVATLGDSYVLDLKLIDVAKKQERRRESTTLSGDQAVLIEGVRGLAIQLVAPELFVGSLELRLEKPGAEVYIDGTLVGSTPLQTVSGITPGKHALKIVLTGFKDFDRFVEVRHDRTTIVNVALSGDTIDATIEAKAGTAEPEDAPVLVVTELAPTNEEPEANPLESPLFLSGLAVGGAGLLLAAVGVGAAIYEATAFQQQLGSDYTEEVNGVSVVREEDEEAYQAAQAEWGDIANFLWYGGWSALGVGLATAVTGGALMAWDLLDRPAEVE